MNGITILNQANAPMGPFTREQVTEKLQRSEHFRDYVLFYEYFHGNTGRGVGASHQTGWTGLVAKLLMPRRAET